MTDPYVWYIYGNIYHQYTPVMLAYIPYDWILWDITLPRLSNSVFAPQNVLVYLHRSRVKGGSRCMEQPSGLHEMALTRMIFGLYLRKFLETCNFSDFRSTCIRPKNFQGDPKSPGWNTVGMVTLQ